jgi:hypothetical protein
MWIDSFVEKYESRISLPGPASPEVERRAHDALRSAVEAEPIKGIRVCSARAGSCPWPYWDYVRVDVVPAKSRRGAAVHIIGGGATRHYRSQEKARKEGLARYPHRIDFGYGAWQQLYSYPGVLRFIYFLAKNYRSYLERHPELRVIADDFISA